MTVDPVDSYCWNNWSSIVAQVTAIRPLGLPSDDLPLGFLRWLSDCVSGRIVATYYVTLPTIAAFQAALGNSLWLFIAQDVANPQRLAPEPAKHTVCWQRGSSTLYTNNLNGNFQPIWSLITRSLGYRRLRAARQPGCLPSRSRQAASGYS